MTIEMKEKIVRLQLQLLQDKIDAFKDMVDGLATDAQNDAKSSAGDKHETSLAMMHLEQEKINSKLADFLNIRERLLKLDITSGTTIIRRGSLVQVNDLWLFISEALPKVEVQGHTVFSLSAQSPLGSALIGKQENDEVEVQAKKYRIYKIV